ncbi:MAG: 3-isopropylmalate/(R)-2-methylmalate dehydratase small subunit [Frankiaceae bacterium]|jgi:3-isopropylmalate/(R)-2-methylmalate dehydratase small subunit|nr:3-isopropylmalate/(R)-2-methylmalate dehydratase small subunit [Frankiaceae bacterium]
MEPFRVHTGTVVPLRRSDVDTDQIIPAVWLKQVSRTGFGEGLFSAWRKDPSFVLNDARYAAGTVLVAGPDFGTGSSREHAVWALQQYGFKAVISSRFADIFRGNSFKNGLLTVVLTEAEVETIQAAAEVDPTTEVTVDLEALEVRWDTHTASFTLDPSIRHKLLEGLDDIALTLAADADITAFEAKRPAFLPTTL